MPASLTPLDLGLPAKFPSWRPGQWEAIEQTTTLPQRFIIQAAPTGFGKSPYAIGCSVLDGGRTVYTTSTKALQDQLIADFSSMGMFDIRGRQNYPCFHYHDCHQGRVFGCDERESCPASIARREFLESKLSVTNYSYLLSSNIHGEGCGPISLLILDEAHNAVQELSDAIEIHIVHHTYEILYRHFSAYPEREWELADYQSWAKRLLPEVAKYKEQIREGDTKLIALVVNFGRLLGNISQTPDSWILDKSRQGETVIAPLWPTDYAAKYLFPPNVERVLLTSATVVPKTRELLGIPESESIFLAQDHTFDPKRCPFYLFGPHSVRFDNTDDQNQIWAGRLDTIIGRRLDRKGIIHTISYDRQKLILANSDYRQFMIAPERASELREAIERYRRAKPPAILVTPSVTTGYDFPGVECEFQIIAKVPFIDARGPIMKARVEADPEYLPYLTAQTIVQICGRGMRSPSDRCENFILDKNANWFLAKQRIDAQGKRTGGYRHLFPSWFVKQIQYPDGLPVPPPGLGNIQQT